VDFLLVIVEPFR